MALSRKVGLLAGAKYKGGGPMLAWALHRISGLSIIIFVFCAIFHGVNGFRIIILDIWPRLIRYQKESTWLEWFVILPLYLLTAFIMIRRFLAG